jgi:hypothetical protein
MIQKQPIAVKWVSLSLYPSYAWIKAFTLLPHRLEISLFLNRVRDKAVGDLNGAVFRPTSI